MPTIICGSCSSSSFRTVSGFDNLVSIRHVTNREQSVHIDSGCAVAGCLRIHDCRIRELKLATIVIEKARMDKNNNSSGSNTQRKRCKQ
jgi:hypothetical protein